MTTTDNIHLNNIYQKISAKAEGDVVINTKMFTFAKNWLLGEMCKIDPVFKELSQGILNLGCYDNQKNILEPNEFTLYLQLIFPSPIDVIMLEGSPGFARLDLKEHAHGTFENFTAKIANQNCLDSFHLQTWINDTIKKVLKTSPLPDRYYIGYDNSTVDHNIIIYKTKLPHKKISIDVVAAVNIGKDDKLQNLRRFVQLKDYKSNGFYLIPSVLPNEIRRKHKKYDKLKMERNHKYTFRIVNPVAEGQLFDNVNLKNVYVLLRLLCNRYQLDRLNDQFLINIFLWEVQKENKQFWSKSLGYLLIHMLGKLTKYFADRNLPYYWIERFDLFSFFKTKTILDYAKTLKEVCKTVNEDKLSSDHLATFFKFPSK